MNKLVNTLNKMGGRFATLVVNRAKGQQTYCARIEKVSDTGKTVLESKDEIRVYCDTNDAVDVSLSVLTGVN